MGISKTLPPRAIGNPAVLFNMPLGFALAVQGNNFFGWIFAFVGMISYAGAAWRFPPLDSRLHGNDAVEFLEVS